MNKITAFLTPIVVFIIIALSGCSNMRPLDAPATSTINRSEFQPTIASIYASLENGNRDAFMRHVDTDNYNGNVAALRSNVSDFLNRISNPEYDYTIDQWRSHRNRIRVRVTWRRQPRPNNQERVTVFWLTKNKNKYMLIDIEQTPPYAILQ